MKKLHILFTLFIAALMLSSCEDVVDVKLDSGPPLLSVDGWITNRSFPDTIKIAQTAPYFSNTTPQWVSGAKVTLMTATGQTENLQEISTGNFLVKSIRSIEGEKYLLRIEYDGEIYEAQTEAKRQSFIVDSVAFEYREKSLGQDEDGYQLQFFGKELKGMGDACRMKIKKNGVYLSKVSDLNYMNDEFVDSANFKKVRLFTEKPFQLGDSVTIETWSITMDAYHFYDELRIQVANGGIFANPPANVRTNVKNVNANSTKKAVGYFGASLVSSKSGIVRE